jgi:hypothetical protein
MKNRIRTTIRIGTAVMALALAGASFAQTIEERRAAARQRAEEGVRFLNEQMAKAQAEAAARAAARPFIDPIAAQRAAEAAAQAKQAWIQQEIVPWLQIDERAHDGTVIDAVAAEARRQTKLQSLAEELRQRSAAQRRATDEFLRRTGQPEFEKDEAGGTAAIVGFINGVPDANITYNRVAADTISADEVSPGGSLSLGLTGTNTVMGLWDGGDIRISHREFSTNGVRVVDMDGTSIYGTSDHGTHVTGTLAAYGVDTNAVGMSRRAVVWANDYNNDHLEMTQQASSNRFCVSNHSYGKRAGWSGTVNIGGTNYPAWWGNTNVSQTQDFKFGFYDTNSQTIDRIAYLSPIYLQVWAAGNERGAAGDAPINQPVTHAVINPATTNWVLVSGVTRPRDGDTGGYDLLTQPQSAKNNLVIGAVSGIVGGWNGATSVVMSTFSSFGPTDDGRIKPDVVADGVGLWSTGSFFDSDYYTNNGTSMASPSAAGALNLLVELQSQLHGTNQPLLASTLRGLAIHTADEAGASAGPDYQFGWGLLNVRRAAELMTNNYASGSLAHIKEVRLVSGDYILFPVSATNTRPLRVSIAHTDPPGTPPALSLDPTNRMLVNDVDLRVISPSGTTNFPYVLDPAAPGNAATTGDNFRDNAEQVHIATPENGTYWVLVTHKGALLNDLGQTNDQRISILVSGNIPQPPILPAFTQIVMASSNVVALKWASEVGRVYRVEHRTDVDAGSWSASTGEISATKTNTAVALEVPAETATRFYRLVQLR